MKWRKQGFNNASFAHGQANYFSSGRGAKGKKHGGAGQDLHYGKGDGGPDGKYVKPVSGQNENNKKDDKKENPLSGQDTLKQDSEYVGALGPQTTIGELSGKSREKIGGVPGAAELLKTMPENLVFENKHIAPWLTKGWCRDFEGCLNEYKTRELIKLIREGFGYTEKDVAEAEWDRNTKSKTYEYVLVERAINAVLLTYVGFSRKSGNEAASHPLRAALFAITIGAPLEVVLTCLFHDVIEDTLDGRARGLKFRAAVDGKAAEFDNKRKILRYLRGNYGEFGEKLAVNVNACTRKEEIPDDANWQRKYLKYLNRVYRTSVAAAFAKGIDGYLNLLELAPIKDKADQERARARAIFKVASQLKWWRRISLPVAELLTYELEKYMTKDEYGKLKFELETDRRSDIEKLKKGHNIVNGERRFSARLIQRLGRAGSLTIDVYTWVKKGKTMCEFEIPYASEEVARGLVKKAFGRRVKIVGVETSLQPSELPLAIFIKCRVSDMGVLGDMPTLVGLFDKAAASGQLLPQLEGWWNRKKMVASLKRRYERMHEERGQ